jgi:hypothetical protein
MEKAISLYIDMAGKVVFYNNFVYILSNKYFLMAPKSLEGEKEVLRWFLEDISHPANPRNRETLEFNIPSELHFVKQGPDPHDSIRMQTLTYGCILGPRLKAYTVADALMLWYQTQEKQRPTGSIYIRGFTDPTKRGIIMDGDKNYKNVDHRNRKIFMRKPYLAFGKTFAEGIEVRLYVSPLLPKN